jgi:hypothetical protein
MQGVLATGAYALFIYNMFSKNLNILKNLEEKCCM